MIIPRSVHASLLERFIFNFRIDPDVLDRLVPASYLKPQVINGWSVVSFCVLKLDHVVLSPLPSFFGYQTISCAYRCGIIDESGRSPEPSVYITDRNTDLPIISRFGPWVFSDTILMIRPSIAQEGDTITIQIKYLDQQSLFLAKAKPSATTGVLGSEIFSSGEDFTQFMRLGVTSYTPSIYGDALAKIDMRKEERPYEPLDATVDLDAMDGVWRDAGIVFDSAVRASGGRYVWTYRGLAPTVMGSVPSRSERPSVRRIRSLQRVTAE